MSYLQAYNVSLSPNLNFVPYHQLAYGANSNNNDNVFSNFGVNSVDTGGHPLTPGSTVPLPASIAAVQNSHPLAPTDYYGNVQNQNAANSGISEFGGNFKNSQTGRRNGRQRRRNRKGNAFRQSSSYHHEVQNVSGDFQKRNEFPETSQTQETAAAASHGHAVRVTPIQGPIFAKNGHVPVVPLYSYPHSKNGTFYQIPILWTALSYALGLEIRGEVLRGLPCIKRLNQLFCPTAGSTYPLQNIERFIDENKALIRRMYGEFVMNSDVGGSLNANILRRSAREIYEDEVQQIYGNTQKSQAPNFHYGSHSNHTNRAKRQTVNPRNGAPTQQPKSNRIDSCESTVEITTPYWAANSAGKVRAIVNTEHFEQAIHQEVCSKTSTKRCTNDCGCEQKYKWHRLLAYDPDNDCRGIFMDWFLFPSCCVCRCNP